MYSRAALATAAALVAVAAGAAPAAAYKVPYTQEAYFTTTISGTYVSTGHDSDECAVQNEEDPDQPAAVYPTATTVEDRVDFASSTAGVAHVASFKRRPVSASMVRATRVHARWTRSRTTTAGGPCAPDPQARKCGARDAGYGMGIFGRERRNALAYEIRERSGPVYPDDPYGNDCALVGGQTTWGKLQAKGTAVSRARFFDRHVKKIVVRGVERRTAPPTPQTGDADSSNELHYTITLVRRRR